jgi:hypothetical protein
MPPLHYYQIRLPLAQEARAAVPTQRIERVEGTQIPQKSGLIHRAELDKSTSCVFRLKEKGR